MRTALTIAGSDSGGGAGIQADLKTFAAHGVFGTSAITAITAQNTLGVQRIVALSPDMVVAQIESVVTDIGADAVKIGMLVDADIVEAVASVVDRLHLTNVVLDPVMISTSGQRLLDGRGVAMLARRLLALAAIVTPNIAEAEALTGLAVRTPSEMRSAAARLVDMGAASAIITGGHLEGDAVDVLYDGRDFTELRAERIETSHTHGTGCTFSSAIAARLALGDPIGDAARSAKRYVTEALRRAPGLGRGRGPLGHVLGHTEWS